jgi:hypothetical protein
MRFSVVGEKSAFCSGGVATAEEPSTVRTPSLQPAGRDLGSWRGSMVKRSLATSGQNSSLLQGVQARAEVDMIGVVIEHERWH